MRNFPTAAGSLRDFSLRIRLPTTEIWSMPWGWNVCLKSGKDNWCFCFVLPHHNPFRGQLEYYLTTCFYCKEPASCPCFVFLLPSSYGIKMCNTIETVGVLLQFSHFHWEFFVGYGTWENLQYFFSRFSWTKHWLHPSIAMSQGRCHIFHSHSCFPICSKFI